MGIIKIAEREGKGFTFFCRFVNRTNTPFSPLRTRRTTKT